MPRLLVIWHSHTGATAALVGALADGARAASGTVDVRCLAAAQATGDDVLGAEAVVFATPETLGSMCGVMKDFFDRSYYALLDRCQGKGVALVVCAGSDGAPTVAQLRRIATGLRLRELAPPLLCCTHAQDPAAIAAPKQLAAVELARAQELGATLAAGLELGVF